MEQGCLLKLGTMINILQGKNTDLRIWAGRIYIRPFLIEGIPTGRKKEKYSQLMNFYKYNILDSKVRAVHKI